MSEPKKTRTGLDERSVWALLADMYDTANDHENQVIQDVLVRSGWCWRCEASENSAKHKCGAVNDYDSLHCSDCGVARNEEADNGD